MPNLEQLTDRQLGSAINDLKFICINFDPYNSNLTPKMKKIIKKFELENDLDNPFDFTNKVLQLLDRAEQKVKHLQ